MDQANHQLEPHSPSIDLSKLGDNRRVGYCAVLSGGRIFLSLTTTFRLYPSGRDIEAARPAHLLGREEYVRCLNICEATSHLSYGRGGD